MLVDETMKTNNSRARWNNRHRLFSLPIIIFLLWAGSTFAAGSGDPRRFQESGELTAIEKINSRMIAIFSEKKIYSVGSSALILNAAGRPISLDQLTLPAQVNYEYMYMESDPKTMSPVIVYIEETQKKSSNGRSPK